MNIQELKASAVSKSEKLQKLLMAGNEMTSTEVKDATTLKAELQDLKAKIELYKDADDIKEWLNTPSNPFTEKPSHKANGNDPDTLKSLALTDDQKNAIKSNSYCFAFNSYLQKGLHGLSLADVKTLQEGADSQGGFLVPEFIQNELVQKRTGALSVVDKVRRLQTSKDSLSVPRLDYDTDDYYTSPIRLTKTGEVPAAESTATMTDPNFGMSKIDIYTHMVNGTVTRDMIEDAMFPIEQLIADKFYESMRVQTENYLLNGTGVNQPVGILASPGGTIGNATQPASAALGTIITADNLIALGYSLEPQYDDNACFVINKTNTGKGIMQLKDSALRYLFAYGTHDSGLAGARPRELVGYPLLFSSLMPNGYSSNGASGVANAYPVIFGDLSGCWMIERAALSIQVLTETKATLNQVQLVGRWRFGSAVVEPWKIKVGKVA